MDFCQKKIDFDCKLATPLVASFISMFYGYHYAMNCPHVAIFLSIFSTNFVLKCATKILKIGLQINILCPKIIYNRDFAETREIIQTLLHLNSGRVFPTLFGTLY